MLLWAFWLVAAILRWSVWGWKAFSTGGFIKMPTVATSGKNAAASDSSTSSPQGLDTVQERDSDERSAESAEKGSQGPAEEQARKEPDD